MNVVFRVDASTNIGMGHVVRCAILGNELVARGASVHFVCRELPGHACDWLASQSFDVSRLPDTPNWDWEQDLAQVHAILKKLPQRADWVVVDHYGLDARWEAGLRGCLTRALMVIDDLDNRPHDCDLLLDQNYYLDADTRYRQHVGSSTLLLLGPRFALLAPAYSHVRERALPHAEPPRRVLVCFGGADPSNHTLSALQALQSYARDIDRVDVVLGAANPHAESIEAYCATVPRHVIHRDIRNMAELLAQADLAIGAGGTMTWERACLGVPSLAFGIADNQQAMLDALIEEGVVFGCSRMPQPDTALMAALVQATLHSPALLKGLSKRSAELVDGKGVQRVADRLLPSVSLSFRPALPEDVRSLYEWRNDPSIRLISRNSQVIPYEVHQAWYAKCLAKADSCLMIAEHDGQAVGVVRFDLREPDAHISVYRVPQRFAARSGQQAVRLGLIREASLWLQRRYPEIDRIVAEVLPDNAASLSAFYEAGYRNSHHTLILEIHHEH